MLQVDPFSSWDRPVLSSVSTANKKEQISIVLFNILENKLVTYILIGVDISNLEQGHFLVLIKLHSNHFIFIFNQLMKQISALKMYRSVLLLVTIVVTVSYSGRLPIDNGAIAVENALLESWDSGLSSKCANAAVVGTNYGISMYGYSKTACQFIQTYMNDECRSRSYNWSCMMTAKEDGVRSFFYKSEYGLELIHGKYRVTLWVGTR